MNNGLKNSIIFVLGAAAGSAVTWYLLKTKYEQIAQEEIESVKEAFGRRLDEIEGIGDKEEPFAEPTPLDYSKEEKINYAGILATHYGIVNNEGKGGSDTVEVGTPPYTISPEDYGELDGYETDSFTYYADGVVTDMDDNPLEDVEGKIGEANLQKFGEYEPDSIYVRNEMLRMDYEVLKDMRNFSDLNLMGE